MSIIPPRLCATKKIGSWNRRQRFLRLRLAASGEVTTTLLSISRSIRTARSLPCCETLFLLFAWNTPPITSASYPYVHILASGISSARKSTGQNILGEVESFSSLLTLLVVDLDDLARNKELKRRLRGVATAGSPLRAGSLSHVRFGWPRKPWMKTILQRAESDYFRTTWCATYLTPYGPLLTFFSSPRRGVKPMRCTSAIVALLNTSSVRRDDNGMGAVALKCRKLRRKAQLVFVVLGSTSSGRPTGPLEASSETGILHTKYISFILRGIICNKVHGVLPAAQCQTSSARSTEIRELSWWLFNIMDLFIRAKRQRGERMVHRHGWLETQRQLKHRSDTQCGSQAACRICFTPSVLHTGLSRSRFPYSDHALPFEMPQPNGRTNRDRETHYFDDGKTVSS